MWGVDVIPYSALCCLASTYMIMHGNIVWSIWMFIGVDAANWKCNVIIIYIITVSNLYRAMQLALCISLDLQEDTFAII